MSTLPVATGTRQAIVFVAALLGALIAGSVGYFSVYLAPVGVAVVAAAGALTTSSLSELAIGRGNGTGWIVLLVIALGLGAYGYTNFPKPPDNPGVTRFTGGCAPFSVYAQNRWRPYGAAVRTGPSLKNKQISNRDPNQSVTVNGWVHGEVAYKTNQAPFNNDVWFHLSDGSGWVSFAGLRAEPTTQDPTGFEDGGRPVSATPACQGEAQ